jgi:hypothetical protein
MTAMAGVGAFTKKEQPTAGITEPNEYLSHTFDRGNFYRVGRFRALPEGDPRKSSPFLGRENRTQHPSLQASSDEPLRRRCLIFRPRFAFWDRS